MTRNVLIVGASRGLGASLAAQYAAENGTQVYGTTRSASKSKDEPSSSSIRWIRGIDLSRPSAGRDLVAGVKSPSGSSPPKLDIVIITAGYFGKESFEAPDFDAQVSMYTISAVGPVFVVQALVTAGLVREKSGGAKVVLVSSESGSIALRHQSEGGGNYGHHASKAALNMVGRLLSLDLKDRGIAVVAVHVSVPLSPCSLVHRLVRTKD